MEGAQTVAELLAPYGEKTQKFVLSMIKEGSPEEVTEQFYNIMESLQDIFEEEDDDADDNDAGDDDSENKGKKKGEDDDDDEEDEDDDDIEEESFLDEGFYGDDDDDSEDENDLSKVKNVMKSYIK